MICKVSKSIKIWYRCSMLCDTIPGVLFLFSICSSYHSLLSLFLMCTSESDLPWSRSGIQHGHSEISLWMVIKAIFFDYNLSLKLLYTYTLENLQNPMVFYFQWCFEQIQHHAKKSGFRWSRFLLPKIRENSFLLHEDISGQKWWIPEHLTGSNFDHYQCRYTPQN